MSREAEATVRLIFPPVVPSTPTPSPYPVPTLIAPATGPIPTNCPPGTPLVDFAPDTVAPGVGGSDVWIVGFYGAGARSPLSGQRAAVHIGSFQPSNYTRVGWPVQVMALIKQGFAQTITLTGHDLTTGYSLWLSSGVNDHGSIAQAAPLATIDPTHGLAHTRDARWDVWSGVLYLPGAGCYIVQANWPGNGWFIGFAAGR